MQSMYMIVEEYHDNYTDKYIIEASPEELPALLEEEEYNMMGNVCWHEVPGPVFVWTNPTNIHTSPLGVEAEMNKLMDHFNNFVRR